METLPYKRRPCKNCPFRIDSLEGWLGEDRMTHILEDDSFVCHKTTSGEDKERMQCAGHMIIKGNDNVFVRTAGRMGMKLDLSGLDLIFDQEDELIYHHS